MVPIFGFCHFLFYFVDYILLCHELLAYYFLSLSFSALYCVHLGIVS